MTSFIQCHPGAIFQQLSSIDIFFTPLHFFLLMSRLNNQLRFKESVYSWLHIQHHLPKKTYKLLPLKTINCFLLELRSPPLAIPDWTIPHTLSYFYTFDTSMLPAPLPPCSASMVYSPTRQFYKKKFTDCTTYHNTMWNQHKQDLFKKANKKGHAPFYITA